MARYHPPRNLNLPFKVLVQRADPDFERARRKVTEYEFSNGRKFEANPDNRGAYADED